MWDELRAAHGPQRPLAPHAVRGPACGRCSTEVAADASYRAVVAELDGEVVGMACFIGRPLGPFVEAPVVQIDYLHVRPAYHRRGVGRALVAAAAAYADEIGSEHVAVNVCPQVREANRFYAKIGFTPLVVAGWPRSHAAPLARPRRRRARPPAPGVLARRRSALRRTRAPATA